jgi:hypothetical protein
MFNLFKKINNEFTNPDSDLLSGRFLKKITGSKVKNEENTVLSNIKYTPSPTGAGSIDDILDKGGRPTKLKFGTPNFSFYGTTILSVSAEKSPEISRLPEFEHKVVPTDEETATITNTIVSTNKDPIIICYRCGRRGHKSPYCHAKTHIKGYDI